MFGTIPSTVAIGSACIALYFILKRALPKYVISLRRILVYGALVIMSYIHWNTAIYPMFDPSNGNTARMNAAQGLLIGFLLLITLSDFKSTFLEPGWARDRRKLSELQWVRRHGLTESLVILNAFLLFGLMYHHVLLIFTLR